MIISYPRDELPRAGAWIDRDMPTNHDRGVVDGERRRLFDHLRDPIGPFLYSADGMAINSFRISATEWLQKDKVVYSSSRQNPPPIWIRAVPSQLKQP